MICHLRLEDAIMTFYPQQISRSNTSPKYLHWFSIIRKRYLASFVITATPPYATSAQRLQCLCNKLSTSLHSRLIYVMVHLHNWLLCIITGFYTFAWSKLVFMYNNQTDVFRDWLLYIKTSCWFFLHKMTYFPPSLPPLHDWKRLFWK